MQSVDGKLRAMTEELDKRKVGRPPLDVGRAERTAHHFKNRLDELEMSASAFARAMGIPPGIIPRLLSAKSDVAASSYFGKIASGLYWTRAELLKGRSEPRTKATHQIERWMIEQFESILQEKVDGVGSGAAKLAKLDVAALGKAVEACAHVLPLTGQLSSGKEIRESLSALTSIHAIALAAVARDVVGAEQLLFDACDRRTHAVSYPALPSIIEGATASDLLSMGAKIYRGGRPDPHIMIRYWVRYADILKIAGRSHEGFEYLKSALQLAEEQGLTWTLSYVAFRSGCTLAAECGTKQEFDLFVDRANKATESGLLPAEEVCSVIEGLADAFSLRLKKGGPSRYSKRNLANLALSNYQSARERFDNLATLGQDHQEFWIRFAMRPLTFADAGIDDLFPGDGVPLVAHCEKLARELMGMATDSDRIKMRLQTMLQSYLR
jgi:hypothetical protein